LRSRCSKYRCDEKKNQIFVGTIFASAFFFEIAFDGATKSLWENANKGVCLAGKKKNYYYFVNISLLKTNILLFSSSFFAETLEGPQGHPRVD